MDSREPDNNVVRLRRNGDLTDEERQRLARTIFAEQDEVGTFSRGNLVPPKPPTPTPVDESSAADPFFEELRTQRCDKTRTPAVAGKPDDTAEYFERLGSQTPAEMSASLAPPTAPALMPGSASLPGEVATRRRGMFHRRLVALPSSDRPIRIPRIHVATAPLLVLLGALVAAGAALAAIVGGGSDHRAPAAAQLSTRQTSPRPSPSANASPAIPPLLVATRSHPGIRHREVNRSTERKHPQRRRPSGHAVLAAERIATRPAQRSQAAVTATIDQSSSQTSPRSSVTQQPANSTPVAQTANESASNTGSHGNNQPAFGANGTLAPGHSPNG